MFRSFRARLIVTVIALVAVTAGFVGGLSYVLVRNSLRSQLIEDAVARAEFNITVLASTEQLPAGAGREEFEASGLSDRFLLRGTGGVFVEFPDGDTFASSLGLLDAGDVISPDLRAIIEDGAFGYQFKTLGESPALIVAGRRPPGGPDFYFFFDAADVDNTLQQLARVLAIAGAAILLVGALGAGLIARRVLRPVAVASHAAGVMAEGDLSVRLPSETADELGRLADSFNRMAASLELQIKALQDAHDREQRFVADVSHELRTPLTALVNEAAMLESRLDDLTSTDRRIGEMLVADVARLRTLVEDLLEVSRLDSAPTTPDETDVDLARFLEAVIADRHPGAELEVTGSGDTIRTDRRSLERIIGNLLDNAANHAPGSTTVVSAVVDGGLLEVRVADEGPGVPTEELPRLFDRFYKTDASRQGGSGLGLAIARQHARRLGGDLTAHPSAMGGLEFILRIPVTEPLRSGDHPENLSAHPEGGDRRSTP